MADQESMTKVILSRPVQIGAVVKDELIGGWTFEAGDLALANDGQCMIDEMDKLPPEDRDALHQPMSQLKIDISKGNVHTTLLARTTIIAGANPKHGRFNNHDSIYNQLNFVDTLMNRFDLPFVLKQGLSEQDMQQEEKKAITQLSRSNLVITEGEMDFMKKTFAYLSRITPVMDAMIADYIARMYLSLLKKGVTSEQKHIPISQRQVSTIAKLAEARAKILRGHLEKDWKIKVEKEDVDYAMDLLHYCMKDVAYDAETGKLDVDILTIGSSSSERAKMSLLKEELIRLKGNFKNFIPHEEVAKYAYKENISETKLEDFLDKLKSSGDIFYPRGGFIALM